MKITYNRQKSLLFIIAFLSATISVSLIAPRKVISQNYQSQLNTLINQYRGQMTGLNNLTSQFSNVSNQLSGTIGSQFNNLSGQLQGLGGQFNNLTNQLSGINLNNVSSALGGTLLSNVAGQFSNLTGQLNNLTGQFSGITNQLPGALQGQLGNLTGQLGNLTGQLGSITGQLGGMGMGMSGGGGGGGNSVPVKETNKEMLSDIQTTAQKTTDILKQMQMEWNFFLNNEKTKNELFKKTQDQITEYLKKDKEGNSRIIEDFVDYLSAPGAKTAKIFSSELDENFLCESFNEQIKQMFNPEKTVKFSEKGPGGAGCTISDTVSDINAFYDDFSQGGWEAFNQLLEPQNNIFGAYLLADEELTKRQNIANKAAQIEALANQGFISERECLENEGGICVKAKITTPGYIYAEGLAKTSFAQLDYIVNSEDLQPYSQEIGNTFLDRMLKEGLGFLNMQISKIIGGVFQTPLQFINQLIGSLNSALNLPANMMNQLTSQIQNLPAQTASQLTNRLLQLGSNLTSQIVNRTSQLPPEAALVINERLATLPNESVNGFVEQFLNAPTNDPCISLLYASANWQATYNNCRQSQNSSQLINDFTRQTAVSSLENALDYKIETLSYKQSTLTTLNALISELYRLLNCQGGVNVQTQSQINAAQQLEILVENDINRLRQEIELEIRPELAVLKIQNDLNKFFEKLSQLNLTTSLQDAIKEKEMAVTENQNVSKILSQTQRDLSDCLIEQQLLQQLW